MILLIDNYDSFTYNLFQYLTMLGETVTVVRNDQIAIGDILEMAPQAIVLSPGPGTPDGAGICLRVMEELSGEIPILGICLGHQIIAQHFGASVGCAKEPVHGKVYPIRHDGKGLYEGLPQGLLVTRYHSLAVDPDTLPPCLEATAWTEDGTLMGLRHRTLPIAGVQFHPEAILSEHGMEMLAQFLALAGKERSHA